NGERAGAFSAVESVITHCAPVPLVPSQLTPGMVTGCPGVASLASAGSNVERRCVPFVPTYPISANQFLPSCRCIVRFHCCVVPAIQCSGTSREIKLLTLPVNPGPHCDEAPVAPLPKVQVAGKPVKNDAFGTNAGLSTPSGGIPGNPVTGFGWNRLARLPPPGRKLTAI